MLIGYHHGVVVDHQRVVVRLVNCLASSSFASGDETTENSVAVVDLFLTVEVEPVVESDRR